MLSRVDRAVQAVPVIRHVVDMLAAALLPQQLASAGPSCPPPGSCHVHAVCPPNWCSDNGLQMVFYALSSDCNNDSYWCCAQIPNPCWP